MTLSERNAERRWVIVAPDGRYTTLGRSSDPSEDEIRRAEEGLVSQGLSGWLAIMQGNPYLGGKPRLMQVRPLGNPTSSFEEAASSCIDNIMTRRAEALGPRFDC